MQLQDRIDSHFRLTTDQKSALIRINVQTIRDILYYFPARYGDSAEAVTIRSAVEGELVTLYGRIGKLKTSKGFKSKIAMAEGVLEDETGSIKAVWFHQPYIAKILHEGALVKLQGKVAKRKGELYLSNPKAEVVSVLPDNIGESLFGNKEGATTMTLYPVYPETKGISSNWIYHTIQKVFKSGILETLTELIPEDILERYNLPTIGTAIVWIHAPQKENDAISARKRFAFEEVFLIQLQKQQERALREQEDAYVIDVDQASLKTFLDRFPFKPTDAQMNALGDIVKDIESGKSMSRLVEGDVGSGKTLVAAATVFSVTDAGFQTAYMAPTEILAKQHFDSFISYFRHMPVPVALLTGSGCYKFPSKVNKESYTKISRAQLLKWVKNGEIPIVIGTHALIQKSVEFKRLALVIIDEQHRFGTNQRQKLSKKGIVPHLISMTATPIPRTLALTIFGDLDISIIDAMPLGRKPIITDIVLPKDRDKTYDFMKTELQAGRQAYVICPRINEPDPDKENQINAKSVKEEAKRLKEKVFKDYEIDILHSKMKPTEKDAVMKRFSEHKIDILVATSVVEVGVNVPNATMIIIEGGERFGLSQLHQLRGRVIRGNHQAYCFVFSESKTEKTVERLKALKTAKNGFELSEIDLALRGVGELYGGKQWGVSDLGMDAIRNIKMVEAARKEASRMIAEDLALSSYPEIKKRLEVKKDIHFE